MGVKKILILFLAACFVLCASGCGSLFSAEYYYSEPFRETAEAGDSSDTEVKNQLTLKNAIMELIYAGESNGQFRFGSYSGSLLDDLAAVCHEIKTSTPIGAYAVEDISYDTSRIVSYYTAVIHIEYKKSPEEIASVVNVVGLGELGSHILSVMEEYSPETVIKIYSSAASEEYISEFIVDSYYADPFLIAEMPEFKVEAFPAAGPERIYHIKFKYSAMPARLLDMEKELALRVEELAGAVGEGDALTMALRCATMLGEMCRDSESVGVWADTAYGCVVELSDSPVAMAMGYKAICDRLGIPCHVVVGERKDIAGQLHGWNIIDLDGEHYHVDVSRMADEPALAFLLSDEDIWGRYDWDREKYPSCEGSLGPESIWGTANEKPEVPAALPEQPLPSREPDLPEESESPEEAPELEYETPESTESVE